MIVTLKNSEGYIKAFMNWNIVDQDGKVDDKGNYLFVYEAWVHPDHRNTLCLKEMIARVFEDSIKHYKYEFVYYQSRKRGGMVRGPFLATNFLKHTRINKLIKEVVNYGK